MLCAKPLRAAICACVVAGSLSLASAVCAQATGRDSPASARLRAGIEVGLTGRADAAERAWAASPVISLDYRFADHFGVGLEWGCVIAHEASRSFTQPSDRAEERAVRSTAAGFPQTSSQGMAAPGNPWLKLWYERARAPHERLSLMAGVTVPAAWLPRDNVRRSLYRDAYALAAATRGLWDDWLWAPQHSALTLTGDLQHALTAWLDMRIAAGLAAAIELGYLTQHVGNVFAQLSPALELHRGIAYVGALGRFVAFAPAVDPVQWSAGGYVGLRSLRASVQVDGLCNLDQPLGRQGAGLSSCGLWLSGRFAP
jgi:hypothetical protein